MFENKRYPLHDGFLEAVEYGNSKTADISVVFLHGWLDNAASFFPILKGLHQAAPSLHLCAIDLPGHGLSSHKSHGNFYPFHDYIDDIYQLLVNFSPNRIVLVGHSLGALVASCYSAAFPEQVSGLVQIEGYGPLAEEESETVSRLREGVLSRQRIRRKPARAFASLQDAIERRAKVNHLLPEQIAPIVTRGVVERDSQWYWRHDIKLQSQSLYRMSWQHAHSIRQHITCPQVVILGEQGFSHLQSFRQDASEAIQIELLAGGHHCHLQSPIRVIDLIFGLVNKI